MVKKPKVVLDSNIIISASVYKGKPRKVLDLVFDQKIIAVVSSALLAEVSEVLTKKFHLDSEEIELINEEIKADFEIIYPRSTLHITKDEDDNRVLEAAVEGECDFIVTGDKELLQLGEFEGIKIVNAQKFLDELG